MQHFYFPIIHNRARTAHMMEYSGDTAFIMNFQCQEIYSNSSAQHSATAYVQKKNNR